MNNGAQVRKAASSKDGGDLSSPPSEVDMNVDLELVQAESTSDKAVTDYGSSTELYSSLLSDDEST